MKNVYKKTIAITLVNLITLTGFSQLNNAFRFKITGNGYSDETIIRLVNGASVNFDGSYDAWKLFSLNPNVPSLYTQISNGQELSINALPEFTKDPSITIYTKNVQFLQRNFFSFNRKIFLSCMTGCMKRGGV